MADRAARRWDASRDEGPKRGRGFAPAQGWPASPPASDRLREFPWRCLRAKQRTCRPKQRRDRLRILLPATWRTDWERLPTIFQPGRRALNYMREKHGRPRRLLAPAARREDW